MNSPYIFSGVLFTVIAAVLLHVFTGGYVVMNGIAYSLGGNIFTTYYISLSIFLAYAVTYHGYWNKRSQSLKVMLRSVLHLPKARLEDKIRYPTQWTVRIFFQVFCLLWSQQCFYMYLQVVMWWWTGSPILLAEIFLPHIISVFLFSLPMQSHIRIFSCFLCLWSRSGWNGWPLYTDCSLLAGPSVQMILVFFIINYSPSFYVLLYVFMCK